MVLLKRIFYFMTVLTLSACQSMDTRTSKASEQDLKSPPLLITSLLFKAQKQGSLTLTAEDESHAQQVLEMNYTKQPSTWLVGNNKDISLTMIPVRTYEEAGGIHCREYSVKTLLKGALEMNGAACRYGINQWKVISKSMEVAVKPKMKAKPEHSKSENIVDTEGVAITSGAPVDPVAKKVIEESNTSDPVVTIVKTTQSTEVEQYFLSLNKQEKSSSEVTAPTVKGKEVSGSEAAAHWLIQLGSFSIKDNATRLIARLESQGYQPYIIKATSNDSTVYRVNLDVEGGQYVVEEKVSKLKKQFDLSPLLLRRSY